VRSRGRLLVVGATGLVGSAVVRRAVDDGWEVTATVRDPQAAAGIADVLDGARVAALPEALDADRVRGVLRESRPEVVVNCVSINPTAGSGAPRAYADGNVTAVAVLLDSCVHEGVPRTILLGSGSEYAPADHPLDEDAPVGPTTLYGATKAAASVLARYFRQAAGTDLCVARPFSLYGPRERPRMFVGHVIASALAGRPIEMSAGTQLRDYLFVEDLAGGILGLARCDGPLPEALNFSGAQVHALIDVARLAVEISGSASELRVGARPPNAGDRPVLLGNSRRAREMLDWDPSHHLREGLTRTIEWYRANPSFWAD
jgi:nucleoside-diphosphate-sugar epimerase